MLGELITQLASVASQSQVKAAYRRVELLLTTCTVPRSWNESVIQPLVEGAIETMIKSGVKRENIVVETVPGSYELPMACSRCVDVYYPAR